MSLTPELIAAAQEAQRKHNVWASVSLAQYGVESAWGRALSGRNNPFGIKALPGRSSTSRMTREVIGGRSVMMRQNFADFDSIAEAFEAHALLLATSHYYSAAMEHAYRSRDPSAERFIDGLGAYATDPNYRQTLKNTCRTLGLYHLDTLPGVVTPQPQPQPKPQPTKPTQPENLHMIDPATVMRIVKVFEETVIPLFETLVQDIPRIQGDLEHIKSTLAQNPTTAPDDSVNTRIQALLDRLNKLAPTPK